jgi:hypothetical protein
LIAWIAWIALIALIALIADQIRAAAVSSLRDQAGLGAVKLKTFENARMALPVGTLRKSLRR